MSDYDGFGQGSSADNGEAEADDKARAEVAMCMSMGLNPGNCSYTFGASNSTP